MISKELFVALPLFLIAATSAFAANKSPKSSPPKFDCKMTKFWNAKKSMNVVPEIGSLHFEIPYSTTDCAWQTYELKAKGDSLIIVQHDSIETCMRHEAGYFLVGKIENLKKGTYYVNVAQSIGAGIRYSLIKKPIKIEIP